jgi:hypothetical protein
MSSRICNIPFPGDWWLELTKSEVDVWCCGPGALVSWDFHVMYHLLKGLHEHLTR